MDSTVIFERRFIDVTTEVVESFLEVTPRDEIACEL